MPDFTILGVGRDIAEGMYRDLLHERERSYVFFNQQYSGIDTDSLQGVTPYTQRTLCVPGSENICSLNGCITSDRAGDNTMNTYCGIDFGTTNTVVTITDGSGITADSFTVPTILFISHHPHGISKVTIGSEALEQFEQGENGRYLHSIKRSLHDKFLKQTIINHEKVTLAELVRYFMEELNKMMIHRWGYLPHNIVLGRPVIFSPKADEDELARDRLLEGFSLAGYKQIKLLEEPVAASLSFERQLEDSDRHFLIIDLGGGTSDFTVVARDAAKSGIDRYEILGIHGVDMGGDHFDEDLMFAKVSPALGINATYKSFDKEMPMPVHLYRDISKWNKIHPVNRRMIRDEFSDYQYKSSDREAVLKLRSIMENNLSRKILYRVRQGKHDLVERDRAAIVYDEHDITLDEELSKEDFETIIDPRVRDITKNIEMILEKTGKTTGDMDKVILTGGSSQIPHVQKTIEGIFSPEKMLFDTDFHNSVSKGLSLYAYYHGISVL